MTIRGGGDPMRKHGLQAAWENGPAARSFAADAHDCIMVPVHTDRPNTSLWRDSPRPHGELPSDRPHRTSACHNRRRPTQAVSRRQPAASRKLTQQGPADRVSALDTSGPIQVFRAIVLPQPLLMRAGQAQVPESRSVAAELVGNPRRMPRMLNSTSNSLVCSGLRATSSARTSWASGDLACRNHPVRSSCAMPRHPSGRS
jgi:hypothetical protein